MLFDLQHILFMVISAIIVIGLLIVCWFFVKRQPTKNRILAISAWLTVIIHFSSMWVDYFSTGSAEVSSTYILPIYPCHIAMWLLLACALIKNKESKIFRTIAIITFYLGIVGGVVGVMLNEIYASTPDLTDWDTLKGLLSHVTMLFGCIYLVTAGFIKIRVSNLFSITIGLAFLLLDGLTVIGLHRLFNLDSPNAMYLLSPPLEALPWFNTWLIGVIAIFVFFIFTAIYEQIALKKGERWYNKINIRRKK